MKIAVVGPICRDINIVGDQVIDQVGGVPYYTANALRALGSDVAVYGSSALDKKVLAEAFSDIPFVPIQAPETMTFRNRYASARSDERVQEVVHADSNPISFEDLPGIENFDIAVLGPLFHNTFSIETLEQIASAVPKVALSAQGLIRYAHGERVVWGRPENVLHAAPHVDYLFLNESEFEFVTLPMDFDRGAQSLLHLGAGTVIVTRGSLGSSIFSGDKRLDFRAHRPKYVTDTTGAGDSYVAGFIHAIGRTPHLESAGVFAAATATQSIQEKGPFMYSEEDVLRVLEIDRLERDGMHLISLD